MGREIVAGDVVKVRSGGPETTVVSIKDGEAQCLRFETGESLSGPVREELPLVCLDLADGERPFLVELERGGKKKTLLVEVEACSAQRAVAVAACSWELDENTKARINVYAKPYRLKDMTAKEGYFLRCRHFPPEEQSRG